VRGGSWRAGGTNPQLRVANRVNQGVFLHWETHGFRCARDGAYGPQFQVLMPIGAISRMDVAPFLCAPGKARSAETGAVNRGAKANREVTWTWKSSGGPGDRNP